MRLAYSTLRGIFITAFVQLLLGASSQWLHNVTPQWSSSLWLGSGGALGCVLLGGPWMLIGVYLGLASYHFLISGSLPTAIALLLPLANIAETSIAYFLLRKVPIGFHLWISKQRDIVTFLVAAPWIPAFTSALIAQTILCSSGVVPSTNFGSEVLTYTLANAGGIILITPLILVWRDIRKFKWLSLSGLQISAHSLTVAILVGAFYLKAPFHSFVLILLIPLIVWGVWANGLKGATLSFFLISFLFVEIRDQKISKDPHLEHGESAISGAVQNIYLLAADVSFPNAKMTPRIEEIGILIFFCITLLPLGLAADTVRASSQKDRWLMDTLDSSHWTWSAVKGYEIDQESVSKKISRDFPLFGRKSRTGQMKIQSRDPTTPAYLSHWVVTHVSSSGEPLEATGLLHCLRLEEKAEKAEVSAEIAKMETATIRSRINPHLLFNCLTGLRALIQRNPSRARDFITLLAQFLRTAVDSQLNTLIPIEQELALCRQYLKLENMRGKRTSLKVTIPTQARSLEIPPMSIQTLVENAVKHGMYSSKRILWIRISARLDTDKKLVVSVSQPGTFISGGSEKVSAGIALVRNHLALMYHREASLSVLQKRKGVVTATITFPIGINLR